MHVCVCLEKKTKRPSTTKAIQEKKKIKLNEIEQNQAEQNEIEQNENNYDEIERKYDDETSSTQQINASFD